MRLDTQQHWPQIRAVFGGALGSSLHYAVASVDDAGRPHVTPIGSVMLSGGGRGLFFQLFTSGLPRRIAGNPNIAIMAVNSGRWFWLKGLVAGRFQAPIGVRLNATVVGPPRPVTELEQQRFEKRIRGLRRLKGAQRLWSDPGIARDFVVHSADTIELGATTRGLWSVEAASAQSKQDLACAAG